MRVTTYGPLSDPLFVTFHDAGKSRAGSTLAMAERAILKGARSPSSPDLGGLEEVSSGHTVEPGLRVAEWRHGRGGSHVPQNGSSGDDERWDSVEEHQGGPGRQHCLPSNGLQETVRPSGDQCKCWTGRGRSKKWSRGTVLTTGHGHESVYHAMGALRHDAS